MKRALDNIFNIATWVAVAILLLVKWYARRNRNTPVLTPEAEEDPASDSEFETLLI